MDRERALPEGCISDLAFDEWRAGELDRGSIEAYEAHLSTCERCQRRHDAIEAETEAFLEKHPRLVLPAGRPVSRVVPLRPKRGRWLAWASGGAALAAAATFALVLRPPAPKGDGGSLAADQPGLVRTKGSSYIRFFVKHGDQVRRGGDEQVVHVGDQLRFTLTSDRPQQVAILSLDAARVASTYYPRGDQSAAVGAVRDQVVDSSVLLDQTLGKEQIWGIFCEAPFELEPLRAALSQRGQLPPLPECSVDALSIVKEAAP
jgi:anti-sigma factor RsiW